MCVLIKPFSGRSSDERIGGGDGGAGREDQIVRPAEGVTRATTRARSVHCTCHLRTRNHTGERTRVRMGTV